MGFFKKYLGSAEVKESKVLPWIQLTDIKQLLDIEKRSLSKLQVIFKYSSRCGTNRIVLRMFEEVYELSENQAQLYFLDLISYREVSNAVAHHFQVIHESPQVLLIKNGVVVNHLSHSAISRLDLSNFI